MFENPQKAQVVRIKIEAISLDSTSIAPSPDGPLLGRRLPLGAGAAMQPFAEMRSLSIVYFARPLGTAAPGHFQTVSVVSQSAIKQMLRIDPILKG
jgi:hypothetical protein